MTGDRVDLDWNASNDDVGVTGYAVFRDSTEIATVGSARRRTPTRRSRPATTATRCAPSTPPGTGPAPATPRTRPCRTSLRRARPRTWMRPRTAPPRPTSSWQASTDNVAVTGYEVYRDTAKVATIAPATSYADAVAPGTYSYELRALDAAGNVSDPSNAASVTVYPPDNEPRARPQTSPRPRAAGRSTWPGRRRATTVGSPGMRSTATARCS